MRSAHITALFPVIGGAFILVLLFLTLKEIGKAAYKLGWAARGYYKLYTSYPLESDMHNPITDAIQEIQLFSLEPVDDKSPTPTEEYTALTPLAEEPKLSELTFRQLRIVAKEEGCVQKKAGKDLTKRELVLAIEKARLEKALKDVSVVAA